MSLTVYSEATIKTQGSYALKIVAGTGDLNQFVIHPILPVVSLSNISTIKFDIRASRTGSNVKIGIRDTGGTISEITPNITAADTYQTVSWDISAISNANKDQIDQIKITVVNADAANTFYIDNMYGEIGVGGGGGRLIGGRLIG